MPGGELETKVIDTLYRGACDRAEFERALNLISELFDLVRSALLALNDLGPYSSEEL